MLNPLIFISAKNGNLDEITALLELVVGVAVLCENKAQFISNIFQLNHTSQAYLKAMVEQVLSRAEDISNEEVEEENVEVVDGLEELDFSTQPINTKNDEETRR